MPASLILYVVLAIEAWQRPNDIITALKLRHTETIADIGAGTGDFTRLFAKNVAKAYAVDIDPNALAIARKNAPKNMVTILAAPDDPKLPPASVDTVFLCNVLHHIQTRPPYYEKLKRALKLGGRVVVIDYFKKPLSVGPPPESKLDGDAVVAEFRAAGFRLAKSHTMLEYQYF
jgi:arsenite methyltransferase